MATWSGIRNKLEKDYLAESLRGHIQYFATSYSRSHDHEGRAAIRYDDKEIIKGCYWNNWVKAHLFPKDETYEKRMREEMAYMDDVALQLGVFDQRSFYEAFEEFDNQSIEDSLKSENLLVRIFAVMDRRVGKRRLMAMMENIDNEPETFREFYAIRMGAEGLETSKSETASV
ncbi:MAG: hypothetical protein E7292_13060 [Lachnospiraceae bacterium]|nr:hypothetical protein [Lachnospiraceae bacterium]